MRKRIVILSVCLILTTIISTYLKEVLKREETVPSYTPPEPVKNVSSNIITGETLPVKFTAPYTGEEVDEATSKNTAFMCIVENSKLARPQSGLADADIVFETSAEGGIPRMLALFQKNNPAKIGPVRSMRPYFLEIAREYNLPFGHCGYSEEAKNIIQENKLMTLNEFIFTGYYWREKDRKAPHNLYTSANKMRKLTESRGYIKSPNFPLKFDKSYWDNNVFEDAKEVSIRVNSSYTASYSFKDGKYYKFMNSLEALNKEDNNPLAVTNIVIQFTSIKLQEDNLHLDIALRGEGHGYVISNGKLVKMKWSKDSIEDQTMLTDENGKVIPLSPGSTWWHIIDEASKATINSTT